MNLLDATIQAIAGKRRSQSQVKDDQAPSKASYHTANESQSTELKRSVPVTISHEPHAKPAPPKSKPSWAIQAYDPAWWEALHWDQTLERTRKATVNAQGKNEWFDETYEYCPQEEIYRPRSQPLATGAQGRNTVAKRCRSESNLQTKASRAQQDSPSFQLCHLKNQRESGAMRNHRPGGAEILRNHWERRRRCETSAQPPNTTCHAQLERPQPISDCDKGRRHCTTFQSTPREKSSKYARRNHVLSHHYSTNLDARIALAKKELTLSYQIKHDSSQNCTIADTESNLYPDVPEACGTEAVQRPANNEDPQGAGHQKPPKHIEKWRAIHPLEREAVGKHQPERSQSSVKRSRVSFQETAAQPSAQRPAPALPAATPNTPTSEQSASSGVSLLTASLLHGVALMRSDKVKLRQQALVDCEVKSAMERLRSEGDKTRIPVYREMRCPKESHCNIALMVETASLMPVP